MCRLELHAPVAREKDSPGATTARRPRGKKERGPSTRGYFKEGRCDIKKKKLRLKISPLVQDEQTFNGWVPKGGGVREQIFSGPKVPK